MKFGLALPNYGAIANGDTITQSARLAEELGYDSVWTTDHVLVPSSMAEPYGNLIESLIALTLAATATSRAQLGTSIIVTPQREPVLLAKQLAGIDVISGGRLILGVGVGWMEQEFGFLSADYVQRGDRFDEGLAAMRTLWRGDGDFKGKFTAFDDALFAPSPLKRDQLPVWMGGNGQKAIRRAAKMADGWHPVGLTPAELADGAAQLRKLAGGRQVAVTLRTNVEIWPEDGAGGDGDWRAPGQKLRGTPAEVSQSLAEYQQAGLEYVVLWLYHKTWDEFETSVRLFAEQVIPAFK
jgi:probable F420-dependent oxidoreductase